MAENLARNEGRNDGTRRCGGSERREGELVKLSTVQPGSEGAR